ncbi:hypothetical protein Droror1_Dr00023660 [Drosera rotundifolia]
MAMESSIEPTDSTEVGGMISLGGEKEELQPTISQDNESQHTMKTATATTTDGHHHQQESDENVLNLMDSIETYLALIDSLSSTLRQGWLELASARHSMGPSSINTALLDLKSHDAATTLQLSSHRIDGTYFNSEEPPRFTLSKWSFSGSHDSGEAEINDEDEVTNKLHGLRLRHRETPPTSELAGEGSPGKGSSRSAVEDQVQKERHKSLAVFGTFVSPKLRTAQLSFETALEAIIDLANTRSSMLVAFQKVQQDLGRNANL